MVSDIHRLIALVAPPPPTDVDGGSSGSVPGAHSRHDQGLPRQRHEHPHTLTPSPTQPPTPSNLHTIANSPSPTHSSHTPTPSPTHSSHNPTSPHTHQPIPPTLTNPFLPLSRYCTLHRPVSLVTRQLFVCCGKALPT